VPQRSARLHEASAPSVELVAVEEFQKESRKNKFEFALGRIHRDLHMQELRWQFIHPEKRGGMKVFTSGIIGVWCRTTAEWRRDLQKVTEIISYFYFFL